VPLPQHFAILCLCARVLRSPQILPVEECVSKSVQLSEGLLGVNHQGVAGNDTFCVAVHHGNEGIRGGLRADPHSRKILLQQVAVGEIVGNAKICDKIGD